MGLLHVEESWCTHERPPQARAALEARVLAGPLLAAEHAPGAERPLRGHVGPSSATVVRRVLARNSFAPVVAATLAEAPSGGGTLVRCELEPHPVMMAIAAAWTALAGLGAFFLAVRGEAQTPATVAVLLSLPFLGPALAVAGFHAELARTLEVLRAIWPPLATPQPLSTSLQSSSAEGVHGSEA